METEPTAPRDRGFTLVELLVVIVTLGTIAAVVVAASSGFRDEFDGEACDADARALLVAAEAYKATNRVDALPPADATPDGYEMTLVSEGLLRSVSTLHDVDAAGGLVAVGGSPCMP
jgi:prepilin-type N-terminal cleavage/methylation domain-containing protein